MSNLIRNLDGIKIKAKFAYLHKLTFALPPSVRIEQHDQLTKLLSKHASHVNIQRNDWPRDFEWILTIVTPTRTALRHLARLNDLLIPRYGEVALDLITYDHETAFRLDCMFKRQFVQSRAGKGESWECFETFYSKPGTGKEEPGHLFVSYSDSGSKITDDPHCCRIEARYQGVVALRQIGIYEAKDWLSLDHVGFWDKNLRVLWPDLARLGRFHQNKITRKRRKKERSEDRRVGSVLLHVYGPRSDDGQITIQQFIKNYVRKFGRGRFLHEVDVSNLRPRQEDICTDVYSKRSRPTPTSSTSKKAIV